MTTFVTSAMLSPAPTERISTSYPTPRTQSTANLLTQLKSHAKPSIHNEVSPASTLDTLPRPIATKYTFSEEEDHVEDKALSYLDRTGHLSQVAGSQSILSQELLGDDYESQQAPSSQISNFSSRSPESIARRYGILTQEIEQDDGDNMIAGASASKEAHAFQTPPRAAPARKVVTVQNSQKGTKESKVDYSFLDDAAMNETQPSLTLSQLEDAVGDLGSQLSVDPSSCSVITGKASVQRKHQTSASSVASQARVSTYNAAGHENVKRKYIRKNNDASVASLEVPPSKKQKSSTDGNEAMSEEIQWVGSNSKRRGVNNKETLIAQEAAEVARRIMAGENDLAKRLLLSMALERDSPRNPPSSLPPRGPIPEGFVWAHYPPLEAVLKDNMAEYYELSMAKRQSTKQQLFNNTLVDRMRDVAAGIGYSFPTDRRTLRDR